MVDFILGTLSLIFLLIASLFYFSIKRFGEKIGELLATDLHEGARGKG